MRRSVPAYDQQFQKAAMFERYLPLRVN